MLQYECVIRRRHCLETAIAACGPMLWDDEKKGFTFSWIVPDNFEPIPVYVVRVDVFEKDIAGNEEIVAQIDPLIRLDRGHGRCFVYPGPPRDDQAIETPDKPKPPGIALTFDPDILLRPVEVALV